MTKQSYQKPTALNLGELLDTAAGFCQNGTVANISGGCSDGGTVAGGCSTGTGPNIPVNCTNGSRASDAGSPNCQVGGTA